MKTTFSRSRFKGFTLIELIIVIAILATLASIAYPTYMSIQENAARTAAKKSCTDIVTGVERFKQDNNGMLPYDPNEATPDGKDQIYLETVEGKDAKLIKVLTNREEDDDDTRLNSSRDTYLRSDEQEQPMGGLFIDSAEGVNFYDPWGQPFYIVLCEEEQGTIDPFTSKRLRGKNCLVYSTGPDQDGKASVAAADADKDAPRGRRSRKAAAAAAAAAELAEEALEDNVYSWKNPK